MKTHRLTVIFGIFAASVLFFGDTMATAAENSILNRVVGQASNSRMARPDPRNIRIGGVTRVRASVEGVIGGRSRDLRRNLPVYQNEEVSTGTNARAVLRFKDGSVLTIGADAEVILDEYVYSNAGGIITLLKGALRFTSGKRGRPGLLIKMPTATIGIRGTDFWAGEINGGYGVLLMHGEVDVFNDAGKVTLSKTYEGTLVAAADQAPSAPTVWAEGQQRQALAGVAFPRGPLCAMLQKVAKDLFRSCT